MTVHRSQGITLDRAYIDVRAAREPGQAYVALSRVRTLEGLFLKDWFGGLYCSDQAVEFYAKIKSATK
jgi:ATP-dependent exoDNAse (exonuclease V) alpha subunit